MRHLTSPQLVDLAEGILTESSLPHLQSCDTCRAKLEELRTTLSAAAEVDVPEPSPLFWDHFSARVRDAVEADRSVAAPAFWRWPSSRIVPVWLGSVAVVLVVLAVGMITRGRVAEVSAPPGQVAVAADSRAELPAVADDASLSLVADLVIDLDWDTAVEAGLTTQFGSDDVVVDLSEGERRELHQLLRMELGEEKYKLQRTEVKVS
jgi:hypothetical protein